MATRKIIVEVIGDASSLEKALGGATKKTSAFSQGLKTASRVAGVALGAIGLAAKVGLTELNEQTKVAAQTNAVLKTTGGIANVTAKQVDQLATAIEHKSGIDDEAIKSAENMLLSYTHVRNEVGKGNDIFNRATQAITDFSVRTGRDAKTSAVLLGKALEDPIGKVSSLARAGIVFSSQQKEQIKTLVQSGKTLEAQKLILAALEERYGGAAEAAGKTFGGQMNIAREEAKDFAAEMLQGAIPTLRGLAQVLSSATSFMSEHKAATKIAIGVVAGLSVGVLAVSAALKVAAAAQGVMTAATWLFNAALAANPITLVIVGLVALGAALVVAYKKSETFRDIVNGAFAAVKATIEGVANFVTVKLPAAFTSVINWLRANWPVIATVISGPFAPLVALATDAFGVRSALENAFMSLKNSAENTVSRIVGFWASLPGRVAAAVKDKAGELWSGVKHIFDKLPGFIKDVLGISSPSKAFMEIGEAIVEGAIKGIRNKAGELMDAARAVFKAPTGLGEPGGGGQVAGTTGLVGRVLNAILYARQMGWQGQITSGLRSYAEQSALYQRYLNGGPLAAVPGTSSHERGEAIDVTDYQRFASIMAGAPANAKLFNYLGAADPVHFSVSGFDKGGVLKPGYTLALNRTGHDETVLPVPPGKVGGDTYNFNFPNYIGDRRELDEYIRSSINRAARRGSVVLT